MKQATRNMLFAGAAMLTLSLVPSIADARGGATGVAVTGAVVFTAAVSMEAVSTGAAAAVFAVVVTGVVEVTGAADTDMAVDTDMADMDTAVPFGLPLDSAAIDAFEYGAPTTT